MGECKKNKISPEASFPQDAFLSRELAKVLDTLPGDRVLVGLSGGADSAMLLVYAWLWAQSRAQRQTQDLAQAEPTSINTVPVHPTQSAKTKPHKANASKEIIALHIHHGLQQPADAWAAHCQDLCDTLGIRLLIKRVQVEEVSGLGIEASARQARYQAYTEVTQELGCRDFLLAHHQNDQAETVLLRLLRGTGAQGMQAMRARVTYDGVQYYRPWLDVPRSRILVTAQAWGEYSGWYPVQDPTNHDVAYTRAAVREMLVPALDERWPSWQNNVIRHAQLMQENQRLIQDLAELDLAQIVGEDGGADEDQKREDMYKVRQWVTTAPSSFSLLKWRELAEHRQANALRYWLSLQNVQMPTQARLNEWMRQLRSVHQMGTDRNVQFLHQGAMIRLVQGRVVFEKKSGV